MQLKLRCEAMPSGGFGPCRVNRAARHRNQLDSHGGDRRAVLGGVRPDTEHGAHEALGRRRYRMTRGRPSSGRFPIRASRIDFFSMLPCSSRLPRVRWAWSLRRWGRRPCCLWLAPGVGPEQLATTHCGHRAIKLEWRQPAIPRGSMAVRSCLRRRHSGAAPMMEAAALRCCNVRMHNQM